MSTEESKTERFEMRITPTMKKKLKEAAEYDNRSLTNYIETVLKDSIDEYEVKKSRKKK